VAWGKKPTKMANFYLEKEMSRVESLMYLSMWKVGKIVWAREKNRNLFEV
jgi:hypothetical protein